MLILRLLVPTVMTLALSTTASSAGPCSQQIAQVQALIDAKLAANAAAGPPAPESAAALRNRQPTPQSIASAESKLGEISQQTMTAIGAAMTRAREADRVEDKAACERALEEAQHAIGP
jgi:hypothetical protein